jgi:large subunit ribosomal protein L10
MALNLAAKRAIVAEVSEVANSSVSLIAAHYSGITVPDMTLLRKQARDAGIYLRVVRNTLAKRAFENTAFSCAQDELVGPMVFAFSRNEPSAAARLIRDFVKTNDKLKVQVIALGGKLLAPTQLEAVAKLPTKDEAISQLMGVMKAPITKLAATLAATPVKLVRTLVAVKEQKEQQTS